MIKKQIGATLIVVLVLLIVITVIGVLAIRQSTVSLGISTNSQVQQLVTQNSDASFFQVADVSQLALNLSKVGMFGQKDQDKDKGKEVVFCYSADDTEFFNADEYSVIEWNEGASAPKNDSNGKSGYCQVSTGDKVKNFFTSGRQAVMTQVAIKYVGESESEKFKNTAQGTDEKTAKVIPPKKVNVYSISLMPSLSSASAKDINTCLSERMSEVTPPEGLATIPLPAGQSISECLTALNVPFTAQVTEYLIEQKYLD